MINDQNILCELILKIGCNESDEISSIIVNLLRLCSINDEKIFSIEQQIHPTTYFNLFTNQFSSLITNQNSIPCQSISCVIFLPIEEKKDFFQSNHLWNFHHKIELINEYKQIIARQDYYQLSHYLPLWCISNILSNQQIIIRFNLFTNKFSLMVKFYQDLFQRKPNSSKIGFVVFNLFLTNNKKYLYQFSIKYSPLIQSYTISQNAYLKFRLNNLNYFIHEYTKKLFSINKYEYYIYDPDGNLLHLYLQNISSNINEYNSLIHINDSGFGDHSQSSSIQFIHTNLLKISSDNSSNDSGQCSSISSNEYYKENNISVRSTRKNEIDYQLKQQYNISLYDSEPYLSNKINYNHRFYSSMNNIKRLNHFKSSIRKNSNQDNDNDISYDVDSPSSFGYLNAFLLKKQQISKFETRSKSVPLINQSLSQTTKNTSQKSNRSKSPTFNNQNSTIDTSSTDDEKFFQIKNPPINIGITLDSRLRKTPVFDMLRSTTMQSEFQQLHRTYSLRHSFLPIARF